MTNLATGLDAPTRDGRATAAALAFGLLLSVPLWWVSGGTFMTVRELQRWVAVVAIGALSMLALGSALKVSRRWRAQGAGVLAGTGWALLADLTWFLMSMSTAGD